MNQFESDSESEISTEVTDVPLDNEGRASSAII